MTTMKRTCGAALVLACALAWGACSDDDEGITGERTDPYPIADTPTQLMLNFRDLHRRMDFTELLHTVSWNFVFVLNQTAVNLYHLPHPWLDHDETAAAYQHIFWGEAYVRPDAIVLPAVVGIEISTFQQEAAWADTTVGEPAVPAKWAPYRVNLIVHRSADELFMSGFIRVFATEVEPPTDSGLPPWWVLTRLEDETMPGGSKRVLEYTSWSELLAMYAAPAANNAVHLTSAHPSASVVGDR